MKQPHPNALLVDIEEAGRRLNMGRTKAFELANTGELPTVIFHGRRQVRVSDLELMVAALPTTPAPEPAGAL